MPHLSKRELDPRTRKNIEKTFEIVLGKLNRQESNEFLFSLLSQTERTMLAKRLAVATLLQQGFDDSSISDALCVTRTTVNRIQLFMNLRPKGFEIAERKIRTDKIMQGIKRELIGLASYALNASSGRIKL